MSNSCPCCSGLEYSLCCQPYLNRVAVAPSPEALMRSRYTAYVRQDADYLIQTWHPSCDAQRFSPSIKQSFTATNWLSLHILTTDVSPDKPEGFVTFFARFSENQRESFIYERSRFIQQEQHWYYIDGIYPEIGRNDRCPCGSGKKFKKCCGQ
ncbi:YchJ family protein [Erwinia endophytica]|uniref:YchJ family protein n=1 Tax=Erwinia endophytica TaxID=1563158 RepID=UPI001265E70C|nr:YchJ family protein [Erwinia endophytica]KAB8313762.1 YchJ family protein [Erwinia endophytica]